MKDVALVVPSIRKESFERFQEEWGRVGLFDKVDLILVEDNPCKTFDAPKAVEHVSWSEIDKHRWSWIIPRRSDTVRSFGYWLAWDRQYKFLMTLDDDCYPSKDAEFHDLPGFHRSMLEGRTKWFNTLNSVRPRGVPYYNIGTREVHVNHGIWQGVLDFDAPQQLVNPVKEAYTYDNRIVPHGVYFPFCGMNWMCRREAIPLMYHLMMGRKWNLRPLPFDRFGDIWCGIIMKKICDHLRWSVSTGTPYIHHDRASNPFTNLKKEANGIEVNEWFWEKIDAVELTGKTAPECYAEIGRAVQSIGSGTDNEIYWRDLGSSMVTWAELFK